MNDMDNFLYSDWYVIQVIAGNELAICNDFKEALSDEMYRYCFVPMCQQHRRKDGKSFFVQKPLFPGYFFIVSDRIDIVASEIAKISRFKRVLKTGGYYTTLEKNEVDVFRAITDKAFNVTMSKGFVDGDAIKVTEGPLIGQEGRIKHIDRHKRMAIVELPFLGKETRVRIPLEIINKR